MKIWKYKIGLDEPAKVKMPIGAHPLYVALDPAGDPCLWCSVDDIQPGRWYEVITVVTGGTEPSERNVNYVGSYIRGPFVGHVYFNHEYTLQP